jgi:hypothetical protein
MSRLTGSTLFSIIFSVIFAFASAAMGPMHGAPAIPDARLQAFITSGGTASDICGGVDHGPTTASTCVFCLTPTAGTLPGIFQATQIVPRLFAANFTADAESNTVKAVRDPALGLRAPPLSV